VFRHLQELAEIPAVLQESIFIKLFDAAKVARFTPIERQAYEDSLKYYRDLKKTSPILHEMKGRLEGFEEGLQTAALAMYKKWTGGRLHRPDFKISP
jgi:hypothetical protein